MIYLTILRRALPFILVAVAILGAWWWHQDAVVDAYAQGAEDTQALWDESKRVEKAAFDATIAQLRAEATSNEERLNAKLASASKRAADNAGIVSRLRKQLGDLAASAGAGAASPTSPSGDGERIGRVLPILAESPGLVEEARGSYERCAGKLEALQEWARSVTSH